MPTFLNMVPGGAAATSSSAATAAVSPRCMFAPWSASPIAASSSVSRSLFSSTSRANARTHSTRSAVVTPPPIGSDPPPQCGRPDRCIPQRQQVVVQPQQGHRRAGHVEGGDVRAYERADDLHALAAEEPRDLAEHDVQLDERGAAQAVDEADDAVARAERQVGEDRL